MSGRSVERYGGHTACVHVSAPGAPTMVFDCGTGARGLGRELLEQGVEDITILFSHTHMDHLFALPYFDPILTPRCSVTLAVPATSNIGARNKINRYLNGVFHPLREDDLGAKVQFQAVEPDSVFRQGPWSVRTLRLVHPGGTLGYRLSLEDRSVCYLTDTGPLAAPGEGVVVGEEPEPREEELLALLKDADLLIMDAMFTKEEYLEKMTWGHCYPEYVVAVAKAAGVKRVALFHHNPDASDADMDEIAARWAGHTSPTVFPAQEGMVVDLSG